LPLAQFPTRAIDFNSVDVVYLSVDELKNLDKPASLALRKWVSSGGNLWIVGGGQNWERLPEVERLLGLPTGKGAAEDRGWFTFSDKVAKEMADTAGQSLVVDYGARQYALQVAQRALNEEKPDPAPVEEPPAESALQPDEQPAYDPEEVPEPTPAEQAALETAQTLLNRSATPPATRWHALMLGQVCLFADEKPFAENPALAGAGLSLSHRFPLQNLLSWREHWSERNGNLLGMSNDGFWNWLVPGVGLAPVTMFQILITLFVLAIGPLNFILLKRLKRLYFLIVTVPLAAAVITLGLFAYAFLTDGISTRVRIRSFTEIDPKSGIVASLARSSYYSSMAPDDGLRFPSDMLVYPLETEDRYSSYGWSDEQYLETIWSAEQQHLQGEWLMSRVPTQFMSVRSRLSPICLEVVTKGAGVSVTNKLQTNIQKLVVCGEDGKFYWGEDIAADGQATLQEIDFAAAQQQMASEMELHASEFPAGWQGSNSFGMTGVWRGYADVVNQSPKNSGVTCSLLEMALQRIDETDPKVVDSIYAPGRFVAFADHSPEVELGVQSATEQASVHVMSGRWKE